MAEVQARDLITALDEASLSRFHLRAVLVSGMGFFTDAYDLFVIGIASTLITKDWNLSSGQVALLNSTMLFAAFLGATVLGRFADLGGRKRVYVHRRGRTPDARRPGGFRRGGERGGWSRSAPGGQPGARAAFERWVLAVHGEFVTFRAGDHHGAVTASLGPDRALRKTYEQSLARAQALGANSIQSARSSVAAASSRSVTILVACLLGALTIGSGVAFWLVRSIALPVARLVAIVGGDLPS